MAAEERLNGRAFRCPPAILPNPPQGPCEIGERIAEPVPRSPPSGGLARGTEDPERDHRQGKNVMLDEVHDRLPIAVPVHASEQELEKGGQKKGVKGDRGRPTGSPASAQRDLGEVHGHQHIRADCEIADAPPERRDNLGPSRPRRKIESDLQREAGPSERGQSCGNPPGAGCILLILGSSQLKSQGHPASLGCRIRRGNPKDCRRSADPERSASRRRRL